MLGLSVAIGAVPSCACSLSMHQNIPCILRSGRLPLLHRKTSLTHGLGGSRFRKMPFIGSIPNNDGLRREIKLTSRNGGRRR
jgi:hypothetical protein